MPLDRWKELNADGVIVGTVQKTPAGIIVQVRLINVSTGKTAFGKQYSGSVANPRRYAHTISDEMFKQPAAADAASRGRGSPSRPIATRS